MTKKKMKTKLAKELRRRYDFDFIFSIKLAKGIIRNDYLGDILSEFGFRAERETYATCGRGCCWEYGDYFYYGKNKKGEYIEFKTKDLKRVMELMADKPEGKKL